MRFEIVSLLAFTVGGSVASFIQLPSTYCVRMIPEVINALNSDRIFEHAKNKVCSTECNLKMSDYESKARVMGMGVIKKECDEMGAPELSEEYIKLLDSIYSTALEKCEVKQLGDTNICDVDDAQGRKIGQCVKNSILGIMFDQPKAFWSVLTTKCEEQYRFFSNKDLWETKFPQYLEEFATKQC
ncbi:hypothetical protein BDV27DRAFT_152060 [Aspergillus caelatus]|uniref:Uncharacterized protein n=1 Tax=Aspergillus caelatus TaxID=61420 RepID=A0A5N7AKX2_9EURO|nr:uncharacterized protein BDV27DRAFT_152060 [Aspergillus caelatus]KAE8370465.1 hypothetical protein BDV27DRAFT_152060 [Aspergillus caelatus]